MAANDELTRFLTRQSPADLDALLPVLVLSKQIDYRRSPALLQMMNRFFSKAGATNAADSEEATARVEQHIAGLELNPRMVQDLLDLLHTLNAEDARRRNEEAAQLLGEKEQPRSLPSNEPAPRGTISARDFVRPPGARIR